MKVDYERWKLAQDGEIQYHPEQSYIDIDNNQYVYSWDVIFKMLDMPYLDYQNKIIIDVGSGPAGPLLYCKNTSNLSTCVEPLMNKYNPMVKKRYLDHNLQVFIGPFESYNYNQKVDETWFFNILQHCIDPEESLKKAIENSKIIRIFEPIDTNINEEHPHSFSETWFKNILGDQVKRFQGGTIDRFHEADCMHGTIIL